MLICPEQWCDSQQEMNGKKCISILWLGRERFNVTLVDVLVDADKFCG